MKNQNKTNSSNVHVVVNTKGGCGKSTCSSILATLLYLNNPKKIVNIFELDDNNETKVNSNYLNHKSFKLKDGEIVVDNIQFSSLCDSNVNNLLDFGGGNDAIRGIQILKEIDLVGLNYYVPVTDNLDEIKNVQDTISLIRSFDKSGIINIVLNRCLSFSLDENDIKKQFINIFGSDELDIPNQLNNLQVENIFFVPNSNIFSILKSHYKVSLLDSYLSSVDLVQNIDTYRQKWVKEGQEVFKNNNKRYRFAKMVIELMDKLEPIRKAL